MLLRCDPSDDGNRLSIDAYNYGNNGGDYAMSSLQQVNGHRLYVPTLEGDAVGAAGDGLGTLVTLSASGGRVVMYGSDIVFEEIESSIYPVVSRAQALSRGTVDPEESSETERRAPASRISTGEDCSIVNHRCPAVAPLPQQ